MKVYVCYYSINEYDWKRTSLGHIIDNSYIGPLMNEEFSCLMSFSDRVGVYGFTDDKKAFKIFQFIHNKKYLKFHTVKMDKTDFKQMKRDNLQYYIKFYDIDNKKIPMTKREYEIIDMDYHEYCFEKMYDDVSIVNPEFFSKKAEKMLESIGYISTWIELYGSEEELDFHSYQLSFSVGELSLMAKTRYSSYISRALLIFEKLLDEIHFMKYLLNYEE